MFTAGGVFFIRHTDHLLFTQAGGEARRLFMNTVNIETVLLFEPRTVSTNL